MTDSDLNRGNSRRSQLLKSLNKPEFRHGYMARQIKAFLAQQVRALRGEMTQAEFGEKIGKPQSVVSRIEKQLDKNVSIQTLIDIAKNLDVAVVIRFVDFPTFVNLTDDMSEFALAPQSYADSNLNPEESPVLDAKIIRLADHQPTPRYQASPDKEAWRGMAS